MKVHRKGKVSVNLPDVLAGRLIAKGSFEEDVQEVKPKKVKKPVKKKK